MRRLRISSNSKIDYSMNASGKFLSLSSLIISLISLVQMAANEALPVYELRELDEAPVPYLRIAPTYPADLKADRIRGHVNVIFIVDAEGAVMDPIVEESSHSGFDEAALKAVRKWKFKPGFFDNKAVNTRVRLPMDFVLKPIEAYDQEEVDVKPVPVHRVQPEYPGLMKRLKKSASVKVVFVVDESGKVVDWEIGESTNERFNESALAAIRQWRFKPGIKGGEPVKTRVYIPFKYTLRR